VLLIVNLCLTVGGWLCRGRQALCAVVSKPNACCSQPWTLTVCATSVHACAALYTLVFVLNTIGIMLVSALKGSLPQAGTSIAFGQAATSVVPLPGCLVARLLVALQ
jgi:hypothetical protein